MYYVEKKLDLDIVQYRLRYPLRSKELITSRSRVPPSPTVREKANRLVRDLSRFSEHRLLL